MTNATERPQRGMHMGFIEALGKGAPPPGDLAVPIFRHGSLEVELYSPRGQDLQNPHSRDEIYVVAAGEGLFFDGDSLSPVRSGSLIFVPAGQEHRFEQFTANFAVWVFFYGPEGGEVTFPVNAVMKRVVITGNAGGGKTTLSKRLSLPKTIYIARIIRAIHRETRPRILGLLDKVRVGKAVFHIRSILELTDFTAEYC